MSYSRKTAEKLIRLFESYAPKQSVSLTVGAPALEETLPDLNENLDKTFKELTWEMKHFAAKDLDTHKVYKEKVINFLSRGLTTEM